MYNLFKYELFRMKKTKPFYVILIIAFAWAFLQPVMFKVINTAMPEDVRQQMVEELNAMVDEDQGIDYAIGFGSMNGVKWFTDGFKPSVLDYYKTTVSSMVPALLLVIFTIIFISREFSSGYIKSIGAYVKMRDIFVGNIFIIAIMTVCMSATMLLSMSISSLVVGGSLTFGAVGTLLQFILYTMFLSVAFVVIPITLFYVTRSSLIALVLGSLETMLGTIVCGGVANLIAHEYLGAAEDFQLSEYFAVFHLKNAEFAFGRNELTNPIIFAIIAFVVCSVASMYALKKRDV